MPFFKPFFGDTLTTSNLVDSHREIILTSVGKEYTIERLKDNFPDSKILLSPILVEEEEEVSE
jgi:hypothetical protein